MADVRLISHLAELCKINMTERELEIKAEEMNSIINLMDSIREVNIDNNNLNSNNGTYYENLREDIIEKSFDRDEMLKNSKGVREGCFSVPKVVE
ncbi:Asp-tRNA(Asn)/Glu-tRNA(Gln) amidotransferase GatCAB subunit C [Clostridium thermosuccinogenes]|jgi:aspartyl/glutamyl-tRNA(Asn/Gln) amidotransferase C subunit|uniref:Asp-tRNA(Asn)/Glu-tRNA(Gln) amidotransferase GatCAB subunit C n=1 Tax=Clostridium thermosuccinogenes TaxID=84032 RepID=A0A2K2FGM0_9CLOT|nr:Asp-tRNA(Asn)/Glu-tRNA(Gln) amidotransferase subunit GatC [Pseudoclostridium thermosuccinogenes]AUS95063.1 Asp-tRNA(Asn)/Glu-tRNA(Gln) amidotransferase GatCAB subunit C [Pseudoclostridium thermosuccinogenes]PNT91435.1 Asp-tRNA(Asn)/Glu-tRNA(Gln) amidotransferase GatCAB subunit C [Pseudoclostridium thermosuccinogenes]PNT96240.1 Asp-tRNA(Asn)/Glu-tRNA(Gln) amidotransferase GatCAB subunit C [Pseudoclostridium thermosuccinogenes]PNT97922.1 Asp-tRNA(Asn)/Glu-tRNA(Gln) amidotransferase GatCAB subu